MLLMIKLSFQRLILEFVDFEVEQHSKCMWDYLRIVELAKDGQGHSHDHGRLCSPITDKTIYTSSNKLRIVFHSDSIIPKKGFKLYITTNGMYVKLDTSTHLLTQSLKLCVENIRIYKDKQPNVIFV